MIHQLRKQLNSMLSDLVDLDLHASMQQPGENIITTIFGLEQGLEVNFLIDQRKNRRILKDIKYRFGTTDNDLE